MSTHSKKIISLEFFCICLIAFSLPLFESPKHVLCLLYLIFFIYRTFKYSNTVKHFSLGNYILIFIAGSIITSAGAFFNGYNIEKLHDIIRYSLVGWMVLHTPLSTKQLFIVCLTLITSTLLASIEGYYLFESNAKKTLELRSVGHVNHSSIYILLTFGITLPLLIKNLKSKKIWIAAILTNLVIAYFLFKTHSRATFIALAVIMLMFMFINFFLHKKSFYIILSACIFFAGLIIYNPPNVVKKFISHHNYYKGQNTPREKLWNTAFHAWKKEPVFGVGFGNYKIITPKKMQKWYEHTNIDTNNKEHFMYSPHSHNRFIGTLAEGGIIGFISLLILLGAITYSLLKTIKRSFKNTEDMFYWLIGANTLITVSLVGLFNTTLHHEHGLLAMLLFGICFNYLDSAPKKEQLQIRERS